MKMIGIENAQVTPVPKIYEAIKKAMGLFAEKGIAKRDKGKCPYEYRSIDDLYRILSKVLLESNLIIGYDVLNERENSTNNIFLTIRFKLTCTIDGSEFSTTTTSQGRGEKATQVALSMAYKYFFMYVFAIPFANMIDEDADIDSNCKPNVTKIKKEIESTNDKETAVNICKKYTDNLSENDKDILRNAIKTKFS